MKRITTYLTLSLFALTVAGSAHGMRQALHSTKKLATKPKFPKFNNRMFSEQKATPKKEISNWWVIPPLVIGCLVTAEVVEETAFCPVAQTKRLVNKTAGKKNQSAQSKEVSSYQCTKSNSCNDDPYNDDPCNYNPCDL